MMLIREGFRRVVSANQSNRAGSAGEASDWLKRVAGRLIELTTGFSAHCRIMRNGGTSPANLNLQRTRRELTRLIRGIIRDANDSRALDDSQPAVTARFLSSLVRGILRDPTLGLTPEPVRAHIMRASQHGTAAGGVA